MPLPPLPDNNSPVFFFDYVTGSGSTAQEHTTQWRTIDEGINAVVVQQKFALFLNAIGPEGFWTGWRVTGVRFRDQGNTFTVPVTMETSLQNFVGDNDTAHSIRDETNEWVWSGRSPTTGRKMDFSLYGLAIAVSPSFRYTADDAPVGFVTDTLAALNNPPLGVPVTIDMVFPTFYQYVNVQQNSYWERKLRA